MKLMEIPHSFSVSRLKNWGLRGGTAIMDQGIYSGSNFLVNILLARWMNTESYGAFAVAFYILLAFAGLHNAIILEPMSVLGPSKYPEHLMEYFGGQIRIHSLLTGSMALALIIGGGGLIWKHTAGPLGEALLGAGAALPFILFYWLIRRFFYALQRPGKALAGSALYFLISLAGLLILRHGDLITPGTGFVLMGLASLGSGGLIYGWVRKDNGKGDSKILAWSGMLKEQWQYGRWLVAQTALQLGICLVQPFIVAILLGLEAAGVLRAMTNFMLPMAQTVTAAGILGIPLMSAEFGRGNLAAIRRKGLIILISLTTVAVVYELMLLVLGASLEKWFYGGKFAAFAWLIPVLGLIPVFEAWSNGYSLVLRAIQKPQHILVVFLVAAPVGFISSVVLTKGYGIGGAAASSVLTLGVSTLVTFYLYRVMFPMGSEAGSAGSR